MAPTMLLTKRLTTFLNNNTSPNIHSLILVTPTGRLLASSSPLPASALRTQATVACTLWTQYSLAHLSSDTISSALPQGSIDTETRASGQRAQGVGSILVQLEYGIMIVTALQSGLLFIVIGPSSLAASSTRSRIQSPEPPSSPGVENPDSHENHFASPSTGMLGVPGSSAPSEAGSLATNGSGTSANIMALKRQAEELAKWLNNALEGFTLSSSDLR